ncbi:MAG: Type 1 glutamine amidotransferase-like domain-containing protein [Candidatus Eisenbacteria bacterium]
MTKSPARIVALLGPQRFEPTLGRVMDSLGMNGRIAAITAGWQEREREDQELHDHLDERTVNLELYARAERVAAGDPELAAAHRERQQRLKRLQRLYRMRLEHGMAACAALAREPAGDPDARGELGEAIELVRALDEAHLARIREIHAAFEARWNSDERDAVRREREEIAKVLDDSTAVAIAGGHVAVLLNRLRQFGIASLLGGRAVFAWSAGAMAISERVVLFHDMPMHGAGWPEVLDEGLAVVKGVVPLPHAHRRLKLDDDVRVSLMARRFAPAMCAALDDGASLVVQPGGWWAGPGAHRLTVAGAVQPLEAA